MQKKIKEDLETLVEEQIIDQVIADKIRSYYLSQEDGHRNRQFIVFGVIGALLVGLGIILIVAHNWDQFNRSVKTAFGLAPLLLAQILSFYTLIKKRDSRTWCESSATLWVFGVGATLSLLSQIYHLPGPLATFMLTWSLLVLPIMYLVPSTMAAVLYLLGITYYGSATGYDSAMVVERFLYWVLVLPLLPYYLHLLNKQSKSNFTYLLNWLLPISVMINLGTIAKENPQWLFATYLILFAIYYLVGKSVIPFKYSVQNNGYRALGSVGSVGLLIALSFQWIWKELAKDEIALTSSEAIITYALFLVLVYLIFRYARSGSNWQEIDPSPYIPAVFLLLFVFLRSIPVISVIVINIILLMVALFTIKRSLQQQHLGLLNYGLLMITALIICRFFDTNMSFILRGLLFVLIGIGFFVANVRLIRSTR